MTIARYYFRSTTTPNRLTLTAFPPWVSLAVRGCQEVASAPPAPPVVDPKSTTPANNSFAMEANAATHLFEVLVSTTPLSLAQLNSTYRAPGQPTVQAPSITTTLSGFQQRVMSGGEDPPPPPPDSDWLQRYLFTI